MKKVRTLFLVDDNTEEMKTFRTAIETVDPSLQLKYFVSCNDVLIYLKKYPQKVPDFLFIDVDPPGMTGTECLLEVRKFSHLDHTPVILYSRSHTKAEMEDVITAGASGFLIKPEHFESFCAELKRILNRCQP